MTEQVPVGGALKLPDADTAAVLDVAVKTMLPVVSVGEPLQVTVKL